jgi:hypothetical protein
MRQLFFIFFFAITAAFANNIVAVLEIIPSGESTLSIQEFRHLTDELRMQARNALPRNEYTILTRDNILQLLPPDEKERECLAEGCAVDVGRAIGAEYVTQGTIGNFEGMLTLTIELYESMSGNMLGSFVTESETARGLLETIREKAPALFEKLSESRLTGLKDLQNEPQTPASIEQPLVPVSSHQPQKKSYAWLAISFDVLGAAALGFGIYKHIDANKLYSDYKKKPNVLPNNSAELNIFQNAKEEELSKANDVRKTGNIALIAGGVLLASGVMVHIWF